MRLRFPAILASIALASVFCLSTGVARAQGLTVPLAASLPRLDANNQSINKRPPALNPEGISLQDCRDDIRIKIAFTATDVAVSDRIEIWSARTGQDCGQVTQRSGATQRCWKVIPDRLPRTSDEIIVPVRAIIADDFTQSGTPITPTADVCGKIDLATFQLQLLYLRPSTGENAVTKADISLKADTVGPPALSGVRVLPGDTRLTVSWEAVGEGGLTDQTGVKVYCVALGAGEGGTKTATRTVCDPTDASTSSTDADPDADAGVSVDPDAGCREETYEVPVSDGECVVPAFTGPNGEAIVPDSAFDSKYLCGTLTGTIGSSAKADKVGGQPLVNGTRYAVAVAATDSFTNVGTLSGAVCGLPEETTDFFRDYNRAGGKATGCASTPSDTPTGSFVLAGLSAFVCLSLTRRRLRRRAKR